MVGDADARSVEPVVNPGLGDARRRRLIRMTKEQIAGRTGPLRQVRQRDRVVSPLALELECRKLLQRAQRAIATELATVIQSVVVARGRRYVMLNAPDDSLEDIIELLPGLDSPTVLPLAKPGWHSVHAVIEQRQVVELLEPLRAAGARSLLVLPIHHLIP
jgi:ATP phosphoribosyltransferase-like protein